MSDEAIDRAARSLVAAGPSPQFSRAVMRRLRAGRAPRAGSSVEARLRRWQLACGALALLLVAVVIWMNVSDARRPATRVAQTLKPATESTPPTVAVPSPVASAAPAPRASSRSPRASSRGSRDSAAVPLRALARVAGPRLAERFVRTRVQPVAPWDLGAAALPDDATIDLLPAVSLIEVLPLPAASPVLIPPIVIPELTLPPLKWGRE